MNVRIIPRLDIKGPNLVKGVHLEGLRVLGKPWNFSNKYYLEGADELLYIDSVASLYGRNNLLDIVRRTAENIFIPLTVGGGIGSLQDIKNFLRAGADKIAINTAAVRNPNLITEGAMAFGSQCIVASIQAKLIDGVYYAYTDNAREQTDIVVQEWASRLVELGAGEILVTSIDREGTGLGYDVELVRSIAEAVKVPVIACGGCGRPEHLLQAVREGKADALCLSSMFHYHYIAEMQAAESYDDEGNTDFLKAARGSLNFLATRIAPTAIGAAKQLLAESGVACRMSEIGDR